MIRIYLSLSGGTHEFAAPTTRTSRPARFDRRHPLQFENRFPRLSFPPLCPFICFAIGRRASHSISPWLLLPRGGPGGSSITSTTARSSGSRGLWGRRHALRRRRRGCRCRGSGGRGWPGLGERAALRRRRRCWWWRRRRLWPRRTSKRPWPCPPQVRELAALVRFWSQTELVYLACFYSQTGTLSRRIDGLFCLK
jgi:hypothetical protein